MSDWDPDDDETTDALVKAATEAMPFEKCVEEVLLMPELIENWNRLSPEHPICVLANEKRGPITRMVDDACGVPPVVWSTETREKFLRFVLTCVQLPVIKRMVEETVGAIERGKLKL